jgi:predicted SAM-dependent methyltransferase
MAPFGHNENTQLTINRMGWSSQEPHEINLEFADFASNSDRPALDLGAGFGAATLAALSRGATVIANDLEPLHLEALGRRVPVQMRDHLELRSGRFPSDLAFLGESLGAVHASNVLHFLTLVELEVGIRLIFNWLASGGKVFVIVNSPYIENFKNVIPRFEQKKQEGVRWPGWIDDLTQYSSHPTLHHLPASLHFFDADVLSRGFEAAGFTVEVAKEYSRSGLPEILKYDGRENVMLIARK